MQLTSSARARPEPTPEALKHFVDVYRTKLHLQPLPLFNVQGLEEQLATGPQFLLWSFMALTMMFSTHPFYEGQESAAVDFYTCTAEERIKSLASEGVLIPELTKSLCLIALKHLKSKNYSSTEQSKTYRDYSPTAGAGLDDYRHCFTIGGFTDPLLRCHLCFYGRLNF